MHPYGCRGHDGEGYGEDVKFAKELQKALREKKTTESWIKEWILDIKSHGDFLHKLGQEHLQMLRSNVSYATWETDMPRISEGLSEVPANRAEKAIIFAAHEIIDPVQMNEYDTVLAGLGISHLAAWLATYMLRQKHVNVQLSVGLELLGFLPPLGQPFLASVRGMESCPMLTDALNILGFVANNTKMLACLSAGQIDKWGNINSAQVGDLFLFGSGGANDASMTAKEVIVTLLHDKRRLVEKCHTLLALTETREKVVTDRAIFEKQGEQLALKKIYIEKGESEKRQFQLLSRMWGGTRKFLMN